jgi:hypothetical protein
LGFDHFHVLQLRRTLSLVHQPWVEEWHLLPALLPEVVFIPEGTGLGDFGKPTENSAQSSKPTKMTRSSLLSS